jgi:proline utilization trans-activator
LETVIFYIGQSQSHFDPREVSNDIDAYYTSEDGVPLSGSPRFLIMVLLFALGKLFSSDHQENLNKSYSRSLFEYVQLRPKMD